jgi:glycosyltransferase EpsJ
MNPKVTIVVPVFKTENTIRKCIDSLIKQSLKQIEFVLVDDGSPDTSGIICDEYAVVDDRVKVIHKKNGGLSSARNAGIKVAQGDYIGFVDSDDYIELSMYEVMHNIAELKNVDVVNCGYISESDERVEKLTSGFRKGIVLNHIDLVESAQHTENGLQEFWFSWRNIYRRKLLEDHALFFDTDVKYGEDVNFNLHAFLLARSFYAIDRHLYHYVENPNGLTSMKYRDSLLEHLSMTYQKRVEIYKHFNLDSINCLRGLKTRVCEIFLMQLLSNAWRASNGDFVREIRTIRNSKMMSECFIDYRASRNISISWKLVVYLFNCRMYHLIHIIFALCSLLNKEGFTS